MLNALNETSDSPNISGFPVRLNFSLKRQRQEVLSEDVFRRFLCWEWKRAERSSRCFLLMLVHAEKVLRGNQGAGALKDIVSSVSKLTRETDITGWFSDGAVLGVIFTELEERGSREFSSVTRARITSSLAEKLTAEELGLIHISCVFLPINSQKSDQGELGKAGLYPTIFVEDKGPGLIHFVKRMTDVVGSSVALILCSPLFFVIALLIKLTSKGPVLFKQERVGQNGTRFTFLKFRSMKCGNDPRIHREYVKRFIAGSAETAEGGGKQNAVYKIQNDPRVTRVGKFLRKTSLDELPQFINVLKGDMSLVGPRPPIPYELEVYQPWHRRRVMEVKPGITGLWQVHGRSKTTFDEMVRLDLRYARTWSLWLDIKILLRTPWVILYGQGAY